MTEALLHDAQVLPRQSRQAKQEWISAWTLGLVDSRNEARRYGNVQAEKKLNKEIRQSARTDKRMWVLKRLEGGSWQAVKHFRTQPNIKHASVQNLEGNLTSTAERAETLAEYVEQIQWQIRFPNLLPTSSVPLGPIPPIFTGNIDRAEVSVAIRRLKSGTAAGPDGIQPEVWTLCRIYSRCVR